MRTLRQWTIYWFVGLGLLTGVLTLAYRYTLAAYEGQSVSLLRAFVIVGETLVSSGFAGDTSGWASSEVAFLMGAIDVMGGLVVFVTLILLLALGVSWVVDRSRPDLAIQD